MKIKEIIAAIPVVDVERAKAFYRDTLGFEVEVLSADMGMYWAKSSGSKFLLYQRNETSKAEHTMISFTVDNIEEAVAELETKGVSFFEDKGTKLFNLDGSFSAWFQDTEGNNLELSKRPE